MHGKHVGKVILVIDDIQAGTSDERGLLGIRGQRTTNLTGSGRSPKKVAPPTTL